MRPTAVVVIPGFLIVTCCLTIAAAAAPDTPQSFGTSQCCLQDCRTIVLTRPIAVPDADSAGALIGPLLIDDDGTFIREVALELEISHPYPADLALSLIYEADGSGTNRIETPIDLYLGRPDVCWQPPAWSCPLELAGTYWFRQETGLEELSGWDAGSLASFQGLAKGGSFYLHVVDSGQGDLGTVTSCALHVR